MGKFANVRRVIEYAWRVLKAQEGDYPQIEALIRQAELDVEGFEWELDNIELNQVLFEQEMEPGSVCAGIGIGMMLSAVLLSLMGR